jgi:serine/threonine protein kinase
LKRDLERLINPHLADFGAAVQLTFERMKRNTIAGTPYYMAPEVIQYVPNKHLPKASI